MENNILFISALVALAMSLTIAVLILPRLIRYLRKSGFVDKPNHRASHIDVTPSSGGLIFNMGLIVTMLLVKGSPELYVVVGSALMLSLVGFWDDLKDIRAILRLFIQLSVAGVLYFFDLKISSLHGVFGMYELPFYLELPLNLLLVAAIINAYNLIDGINGLASGLALISSLVFGVVFLMNDDTVFTVLSFSLAGSLFGFLKFNFHRAKVFMGDAGSLVIGLCMAIFFMRAFNGESTHSSVIAMSAIMIPFLDMVKVFLLRISRKKSPFEADRTHLHHYFLKLGDSHRMATVIIYLFQLGLVSISIGLVIIGLSIHMSMSVLLAMTVLFYAVQDVRALGVLKRRQNALHKELLETQKANYLLTIK